MESTHHTDHEKHEEQHSSESAGAKNALAAVGFIALIIIGILLAIYTTRFIPEAVSTLAPHDHVPTSTSTPQLAVVATTSVPFTQATTTVMQSGSTVHDVQVTGPASSGKTTSQTSAPATPRYYGLPNLSTTIIATGYLAGGTTDSFVPSQFIPAGARAAIRFSIANTGTNVSGPWHFSAVIPTHNSYVFNSPVEQSLAPGDHIVFTLGFDQANWGANEPITVIADTQRAIAESNEADNSATATITVR